MNREDQQQIAQKIRTQYVARKATELDTLRELDASVRRPVNIFSYVLGSISAIIMGAGMSLVMTDIGASLGIAGGMVPGIIIGAVGLAMAIVNYPLHKVLLARRKAKYGQDILNFCDKILNK